MKNPILFFLLGCLATFLLIQGCNSCKGKPTTNETNNIDQVDSLKIIQTAVAPLKGQIVENEIVIQQLAATIDQLRAKEKQGNKRAGELADIIERQKAELEREGAKLKSLTLLLAETKAQFQADVTVEEGVGSEVGEDLPNYKTKYTDPDNWFSLSGTINPNTEKADYSLSVRNEFVISDFVAKDGVASFRVGSKNPFTSVLPGTNTFQVPITLEKPKNRRLGFGITAGAFAGKDFFSKDITALYGAGIGFYYRIL